MKNKSVYIAVVSAVVVAVVAGAVWVVLGQRPAEPIEATVVAPPGQGMDVAVALELLESEPQQLVPVELEDDLDGQLAVALPPGSTVEADPESWAPDGIGGGVMTVTLMVPGEPPADYAAVMVGEPDGWKVLSTAPIVEVAG